MNVIADRLFALLLGWTKTLFNGLWNLLGNRDSGAIGFIQRFWLPLILILMAVGVVMDYVIWLIRWRPYFVWRTWLRNFGKSRRERITRSYMESLDHSPLDLPGFTQENRWQDSLADGDVPVYFDFEGQEGGAPEDPQAAYGAQDAGYYEAYGYGAAYGADFLENQDYQEPLGPDTPYIPPIEEDGAPYLQSQRMGPDDVWDPLAAEPSWMSLFHQARQRQEEEASLGIPPRSAWKPELEPEPQEADLADTAGMRRRRSERARRKPDRMRGIRDALFSRSSDEHVDSLPPPVNPDSAFRQPYIPQNYRYSSGPGPQGGNNG
ncbi:MAG TPA: hypothetical protein VLA21_03335, partial [Candidatus Limnocylindria bacterium]|nr:hypothetical protein [Candidatus Limnocylindria bacterium]